METAIASILFFAAALVCTVASIVLSFQTEVQWSVALGIAAIILVCAGMFFVLGDMKKQRSSKKNDEDF